MVSYRILGEDLRIKHSRTDASRVKRLKALLTWPVYLPIMCETQRTRDITSSYIRVY
jgi:hypothetical protein